MKSPDRVPESAAKEVRKVGRGLPPKEHQFKPGQSGNPKGRPRGSRSLSDIAWRILNEEGGKQAEQIVRAWIIQAAKGNGVALKQLLDRIDGAVKEEREHSGDIVVRVVRTNGLVADPPSGAGDAS